MSALQARAMAEAGYSVLQIDLHGCGDSSGDFGDATWDGWVEDVVLAGDWLQQACGGKPWLWGLRSGCLLACEAAKRIAQANKLLLWQPVISGKQFLQQFLRLKLAGEMMGGEAKGCMERVREDLALGRSVEIAGYSLSPGLAGGLEKAELSLPERPVRAEWIELSGKPDAMLSPAACARLEKWNFAGHAAHGAVVCGPSFWQTSEIEECPALIDVSLETLAKTVQP